MLSTDQLRGMISANQEVGDLVLGAFVARRALLVGMGLGLQLVGSRLSPGTRRLREFLTRNRIPHGFLDLEIDEHAERLLRDLRRCPDRHPACGARLARAAQPDDRRGRRGAQSQTAARARSGRGRTDRRRRPGGSRGRGLRRLGGARRRAGRFGGDRRTGEHVGEDRELPRLPGGDLGIRPGRARRPAGEAIRRNERRARDRVGHRVRRRLSRGRARGR